jgi:hypothetical protein
VERRDGEFEALVVIIATSMRHESRIEMGGDSADMFRVDKDVDAGDHNVGAASEEGEGATGRLKRELAMMVHFF